MLNLHRVKMKYVSAQLECGDGEDAVCILLLFCVCRAAGGFKPQRAEVYVLIVTRQTLNLQFSPFFTNQKASLSSCHCLCNSSCITEKTRLYCMSLCRLGKHTASVEIYGL